jgi:hypothetical protein
MMRPVKVLALGLGLLSLQGCTTTHIFAVEDELFRGGSVEPAQARSFGGGAIEKPIPFECPTNSVVEVRVKRDLFNSLIGVLTLGLYQVTEIEYMCGKNPDDEPTTLGSGGGGRND